MKKLRLLSSNVDHSGRNKVPRIGMVIILFASIFLVAAMVALSDSPTLAAQTPSPSLSVAPPTSTIFVGNSATITINVAAVTNLYGYQFQVNYDPAKAAASGAFLNGFLDSTNAFIPSNWNATCAAGVCRFALTKLNPTLPVSGSGSLATITFTGLQPGQIPLTFSGDILADRNGIDVGHTSTGGTLTIHGHAHISGTILHQGRSTPITSGTITLTDNASLLASTVVTYDATSGIFSATVPVDLGGATYNIVASHSLFLSNQLTGLAVAADGDYTVSTTTLKGGDANNDGTIDILDLACVGGDFRLPPSVCGTNGSSDINGDGSVDILDLVLIGGNFRLSSPQPW